MINKKGLPRGSVLLLKAAVEAEVEVRVMLLPGSCCDEAGDGEAGDGEVEDGEARDVMKLQKEWMRLQSVCDACARL